MAFKYFFSALLAICVPAIASDQSGPSSSGGLFQVILILALVLGLMLAAAWVLRKFNATKMSAGATVKIVGGIAVGSRERIIVVEVADQWIVVGVAPGRVNTLSTMPKQETPVQEESPLPVGNFPSWLKHMIERRNGK